MSVYVRGPLDMESALKTVCENTLVFLMKNMKRADNPMATAESAILETLCANGRPDPGAFGGVNFDRLMFEMEIKQKLVKKTDGGYLLTPLGRKIVD